MSSAPGSTPTSNSPSASPHERALDHDPVRPHPRRVRRAARRRAPLPTRSGVGRPLRTARRPADITNLPKALRARLDAELPLALDLVTESVSDRGDTVKFLWELDGGSRVETVLMLYPDRATVCVSSQAGCAMACGFCATGQAGFTRHLTDRRDRRTGRSRCAHGEDERATGEQHRVHGDGRTDGQPRSRVGRHRANPRRHRAVRPPHHHLDRRDDPRDPSTEGPPPAGEPRGVAPCRQRRTAQRAGADQQALSDRRSARRLRGVPRGEEPTGQLRVGDDRRRQRP